MGVTNLDPVAVRERLQRAKARGDPIEKAWALVLLTPGFDIEDKRVLYASSSSNAGARSR